MPKRLPHLIALVLLLSAWRLLAQTTSSPSTSPSSTPRTRQEPCWQVAGVSKTIFEENQAVERDKHSQVMQVCSDSSLTQQQKMEKIKEIREQAQQKTDGLITSEQQKSITACRQQRGHGEYRREGGNPCLGMGTHGGAQPSSPNGDSSSSNSSDSHN